MFQPECVIFGPYAGALHPWVGRSVVYTPWGYYEVDTGDVICKLPNDILAELLPEWRRGDDGSSGLREPRSPKPSHGSGAAAVSEPGDVLAIGWSDE